MTKEDVLNKFWDCQDDKLELQTAITLSPGLRLIYEAMDEYAKQQVVDFQKWSNLNGWFWYPNGWVNYHGEAMPKTTEELYAQYLSSIK